MSEETPEQTRRQERTPVVQMVVVGVIASAVGIGSGLAIDWFPTAASSQAGPIDDLWDLMIWASVPVFVLVTVIVLFSAWKFHMRPGEENLDGPPIHGNTRLEVVWTAIPAIILVALCSWAYVVLTDIEEAQANEMRIDVTGQQFAWSYAYPQSGGKPIRSNILYLAKGRPVRFNVRAMDVLHDFWVPAFRMKIDAVPGIGTRYRVTPNRLGTYPVVCAELCGLGHSVMRSTVKVVPKAEFDKWIAEQKAGAAPPAAEGGEGAGGADAEAQGCGGCHALADAGSTGGTGPDLDEGLAGKDDAFIEESIVDPSAEIAEGFQDGIMPPSYGQSLTPAELDSLVKYLAEVTN